MDKPMAENKFTITINIKASKEDVWNAVTDFSSYSSWNSILLMKNNDRLDVGKKFDVTIFNNNGRKSTFKAITISKDPMNSFSAKQIILANWFFTATHYFVVKEVEEAETKFIQSWVFKGLLFKPFKKMIFKQLALFNTMNAELKSFLEGRKEAVEAVG